MVNGSKTANRTQISKGPLKSEPEHRAERVGRGQEPGERKLREERILDTAAAMLVRWGYRKTTIDDVAREAGVGKGTIYLHWKDKNELFRAAILRVNQQVSED